MSLLAYVETAFARWLLGLPRVVVRVLAGRAVVMDGRTLDPQLQLAIRASRIVGKKPSHELGVEVARRELEVAGNQLAARVLDVDAENDTLAARPVRIYRVRGDDDVGPALVFFHGGGHVAGSLDSYNDLCRGIALHARCTVISVDYRRAPEHPFPAGVDDATAVFRAVIASAAPLRIDRSRVAVGGDSAGGNIAAVVSLDTRNDETRPCAQLLVYPVVDLTMSFPSVITFATGFLLEKATIEWYRGHYIADTREYTNPRASPLHAADHAGLPPAIVVTAGFDPLRDEGDAYAEKLRAAGVPVEHRTYPGMFHGFWNTAGVVRAARVASDEIAAVLRAALAVPQ